MRKPSRTPLRGSRNSQRETESPSRGRRAVRNTATEEAVEEKATPSRSSLRVPKPSRVSEESAPVSKTKTTPPTKRKAKQGWGAVDDHAKEVEASQSASKNRVSDFYLRSDEEADIQFLSTEPYIFNAHSITTDEGRFKLVPCQLDGNIPGQDEPQTHCVMCDAGIKHSWRAGFLVLDHRGQWDKDLEDYSWEEPVVRKWAVGATVAQQIKKAFTKFSDEEIQEVVFNVARSGSGAQDTTYNFQRAFDGKELAQPFPYEDYDYPMEEDAFSPYPDSYMEKVGFNQFSSGVKKTRRR